MNTYSKIKFWSLPIVGAICIFLGAYLFPYGPEKRAWAELCLLAGLGQLVIFAIWLYIKYRRKNKKTANA